jgi:hypothetical protein
MGLLREDGSLAQWLHVSKYPPSVTYDALELGIGWLLLALFLVWRPPAWADAVLRPLGQSAFFFYLLHAHLLALGRVRAAHAREGGPGGHLPSARRSSPCWCRPAPRTGATSSPTRGASPSTSERPAPEEQVKSPPRLPAPPPPARG